MRWEKKRQNNNVGCYAPQARFNEHTSALAKSINRIHNDCAKMNSEKKVTSEKKPQTIEHTNERPNNRYR